MKEALKRHYHKHYRSRYDRPKLFLILDLLIVFLFLLIVGELFVFLFKLPNNSPNNTNQIVETNSSKLKLRSAAIYTTPSGDQVGIGPNPPEIGKITTYLVIIAVDSNTTISNAVVVATLGPGVNYSSLANSSTTTLPKYSAFDKKLRWVVGNIDAISNSETDFFVEVRRDKSADLNKPILENLIVTGVDVNTGLDVEYRVNEVAVSSY